MFMDVVASDQEAVVRPDLAGIRMMVTGLTSSVGVDLCRVFAEHRARMVIQSPEASPEIAVLASVLAQTADEIKLYNDAIEPGEGAVRFAQTAAQVFGGLDAVINLVTVTGAEMEDLASVADVEALATAKLLDAALITKVAANRMRLTWTEGMVLNVIKMAPPATPAEAAIAGVLRTALATMTRKEAEEWSGQGIRINAIGPRALLKTGSAGACLTSEADIAALALHLASKKGRALSGHVFDAEGISTRGC